MERGGQMIFKNLKIRQKIVITIVVSLLLQAIVLTMVTSNFSKNLLEDEILASTDTNGREITRSLDLVIENIMSIVDLATKSTVIQGGIRYLEEESIEGFVDNESRAHQLGKPIQELFTYFEQIKSNNSNVFSIGIGDMQGNYIRYPKRDFENYDPRERSWYQEGKEASEIIVSEPFTGSTGELLITVLAPIKVNETFKAVLAIHINTAKLATIANNQIGENGYTFLIDQNSYFISHPNSELIGNLLDVEDIVDAIDKGKTGKPIHYVFEETHKVALVNKMTSTGWLLMSSITLGDIATKTNKIIKNTVIISSISVTIFVIIGYLMAIGISKPIEKINRLFRQVAQGDLSCEVDVYGRKDEIGDLHISLQETLRELRTLFMSIKKSGKELYASSEILEEVTEQSKDAMEGITSGIYQVSEETYEQTKEMDRILRLTSELDQNFVNVTTNVDHISKNSNDMICLSNDRHIAIDELIGLSQKATKSVNAIGKTITDVNDSTTQINMIMTSIQGIADQINLLALNASIEAARAGEHGRGFAVVADEIKNLSEQTKESAVEIQGVLDEIKQKSKESVEESGRAMTIFTDQENAIKITSKLSEKASMKLAEVEADIDHIRQSVQVVKKSKDEIVQSVGVISTAIQEINATTEEVSASTEEQMSSLEEVSGTAKNNRQVAVVMQEQVNKFKIN